MKIKLQADQILIVDPCYIKSVKDSWGDNRYDALALGKVWSVDDGSYSLVIEGVCEYEPLEVDSGRIWAVYAEFDCEIELSSPCYAIAPQETDLDKVFIIQQ